MTWTRLPDDFTDRPAVLRLGRSARLLHIEALIWCNRLLTNGVIPTNVLRRVSDSDDLDRDVAELAGSGLWTRLDDDAWQVDWSDQEAAETVASRRKIRNERQQRYNERKERHANHDHSICDPRFCPYARNASSNASRNQSDDGLPTRPDPTRPVPTPREGQGQVEGVRTTASATAPAARPPRASDGQLTALDADTLAALPFDDVGERCPHMPNGWTWTKDDKLACGICHRAACAQGDGYDPIFVSTRLLTRGSCGSPLSLAEWSALLDVDPDGTSLALDLASVVYHKAGPPIPDPTNVNALAEDIYRRSINAERLTQIRESTRSTDEQS